ncbi:MAG: hypothetical protein ACRCVJ_11015 [Clostridium sp.]|uniref:hypothetical protein n=1 Tax=Clostridium sp. TaxID=1506 RepID=UPI003F38F788
MKKISKKSISIVLIFIIIVIVTGGIVYYEKFSTLKVMNDFKAYKKGYLNKCEDYILLDRKESYDAILRESNKIIKDNDIKEIPKIKGQMVHLLIKIGKENRIKVNMDFVELNKIDFNSLDDKKRILINSKKLLIKELINDDKFVMAEFEINQLKEYIQFELNKNK